MGIKGGGREIFSFHTVLSKIEIPGFLTLT